MFTNIHNRVEKGGVRKASILITSSFTDDLKVNELIAKFIGDQDVKPASRMLYFRQITLYFNWVKETGLKVQDIKRPEIVAYKENLLASGMSTTTVSGYLGIVRKFYEWTESHRLYPNVANGVKSPRIAQGIKKLYLAPQNIQDLIEHYENGESLRDLALINLMLRTGLRTIEVIRADVEDITFKSGVRVLLIHGKGRDSKDGYVKLTDKAYLSLKAYLDTRKDAKAGEPLFASSSPRNQNGRMTTRSIRRIVKEGLKVIGLEGKEYSAHSLRHTTAVTILRAGGLQEDAQQVLRHLSPLTTELYVKALKEERRLERGAEDLIDKMF